jgi:hypothetical protein
MKKKSLLPGNDLTRVWVCTACDMIPGTQRDTYEVWELGMEGAAYLLKAAPFDSYSLRCLSRAMMKRKINDSFCVIPVKV